MYLLPYVVDTGLISRYFVDSAPLYYATASAAVAAAAAAAVWRLLSATDV